jgi:hypothetical protein
MVGSGMAVDAQSSRGPSTCDGALYPEVVAPGVLVWTSDLLGGYVEELGTSFAAPHVAGAMALLSQAYPGATVAELEFVLTDSALDLGTTGPDNVAGYGLIDVVQAHSLMATLPCNDVDGDGFGLGATCLVLDCDDADDQVWREPAEVSSLVFTNGQTLEWNAPVPLGGAAGSVRYDVIRSGDPSDFAAAGSCVESDDGTDRVAVDVQPPSAGQIFFYLVRADNDCAFGEGSLGTGNGGPRTGRACP